MCPLMRPHPVSPPWIRLTGRGLSPLLLLLLLLLLLILLVVALMVLLVVVVEVWEV